MVHSGTPAIQTLSSALAVAIAQHVGGTNSQSSSASLVSPPNGYSSNNNVPPRLGSTTARTSTRRRLRSGSRLGERQEMHWTTGCWFHSNSNCQSAGESLVPLPVERTVGARAHFNALQAKQHGMFYKSYLYIMSSIHENISRSSGRKRVYNLVWVRERRVRESIVMKVRNIHGGTTEMVAETVAWSIRDKGPVESQYHEVHNQVPCPTASSKMSQKLFVMNRCTVVTAGLGGAGLPVCL